MEKKKIKIKELISKIFLKPKKDKDVVKLDEVIEIFEHVIDKYQERVMLKAVLSNEGKVIEIYSTNFKTTLNKAKKVKKEDNEELENAS